MQSLKVNQLLYLRSRESKPDRPIKVGGRLHDSAIGAIYFAKYKNADTEEALILKTVDLQEQNLWAITKDQKRTTIRGLPRSSVLFLSESKSEAKEWFHMWCKSDVFLESRKTCLVAKICWLYDQLPVARDGANQLVLLNEFLNEAVVGYLVSNHVRVPHIIKTRDFWIKDATGLLLQDYGGQSIYKSMVDISLEQFQSIMIQVLVTLSICQTKVHLKHHDMHLENVFLNALTDKDHSPLHNEALNSKAVWAYRLVNSKGEPFEVRIKHHNKLAKIGDFGLSSATDPTSQTRYERADYALLDSCEAEWGEWSGRLDCMKSYDAVTLLSRFFLEDESSYCHESHSAWARTVFKALKEAEPMIECTTIGRPMRAREGNMALSDILQLKVFEDLIHCTEEAIVLY